MTRSFRLLGSLAALLVTTAAIAADKPSFNAASGSPRGSRPRVVAAAPDAIVRGVDARTGAPTMLFVGAGQGAVRSARTPADAAIEHLATHAARYGLSDAALANAEITAVHDTGRGGIVVKVRQRVDGVEVFHSDANVLLDRALGLVAIGGHLHPAAVRATKGRAFAIDEAAATSAALSDLYDLALTSGDFQVGESTPGDYHVVRLAAATSGVSLTFPARAKRVLFPLPNALVAAWFVEVSATRDGAPADAYAYVIAADDGRVLYRENLKHSDQFTYNAYADTTGDFRPKDGPIVDYTPYPASAPNGSVPALAPPALVTIDGFNKTHDPWLATVATTSDGNNVDAYTDDGKPEGFSANDVRASTTAASTFDHTYDQTLGPQANVEQREASVTSLFYTTNWLHDWWYDSGFDEAGGNAQKDNLGRGGLGSDALQAEAQFQAPKSRDNSDMSVFGDGVPPRMHMFVWDGAGQVSLTAIEGATTITTQPSVGEFGPQTFATSGVLATTTPADGCAAITTVLTGQIALVDRGTCTFNAKAAAAQAAGAIGFILADNEANEPAPPMGDDPDVAAAVTIPAMSVSLDDATTLKAAIAKGPTTATLTRATNPDIDGSIDNTVVAHEWGHMLHLRNVACESALCSAESEGWADFNALMMVIREGDDLDGTYALAQYATRSFPDDPAYFGIRRYPYSTDFTKNALTFKHITSGQALPANVPVAESTAQGSDNAEAHAAGEIWASMLFESYIAILKRTQGPTPAYTFAEARRRMSDYVVAGMKTAPVDPTYTEQRDAVLAAAQANDPADANAIATAFAKRGAGTCAVSPDRDSIDFTGVVEAFDVVPDVTIASLVVDDAVTSCDHDGVLDAGETGNVTIKLQNHSATPTTAGTATITSTVAGVTFPSGPTAPFDSIPSFASTTITVPITLGSMPTQQALLALTATLAGVTSCSATPTLSVSPRSDFDDVTTGDTTDGVEASTTTFTLVGDGAADVWSRVDPDVSGNHVWAGIDTPAPTDTSLVTPPLAVSATDDLVLTFTHRHQFETGQSQSGKAANYDGSVIEVSADNGKTWVDSGTLATSPTTYEGEIGDPDNQATNVLKGRQGYVGQNKSFPATDAVTINFGTSLAGKAVKVRFRIGTDDAAGGLGWEIDDIGFTGIVNAPFSGIVDDANKCAPTGSSGAAGAGGSAGAGGTVKSAGSAGATTIAAGSGGAKTAAAGTGGNTNTDATADIANEHSDGGCATSGGAASGGLSALLIGLAGLFARRRRG